MVTVFLANGFEEVEALTCVDILRRGGADVVTVGVGGRRITGSHGITVEADADTADCGDGGRMLVLPGGGLGTANLCKSDEVKSLLLRANEQGDYIAAICAAPTVLGHLGLLAGKRAVCYPGMEDGLTGAKVCFDDVCVDGNIITGRAAGASAKFALTLLRLLKGEEAEKKVKAAMLW